MYFLSLKTPYLGSVCKTTSTYIAKYLTIPTHNKRKQVDNIKWKTI